MSWEKKGEMTTVSLLVFLLWAGKAAVEAHVALTFPPARYPPLDFLDNARTTPPCGVPRPQAATFTTLYTNTPYNLTWRMQYPHQGGYRLTLLDATGRQLQALTRPSTSSQAGFSGLEDQTFVFSRVQFV
uniref:Uncharacterized protein n=1 Tax=Plectus sambesii TaxID=2011161 RepID=A0A914XNI3_9BILA